MGHFGKHTIKSLSKEIYSKVLNDFSNHKILPYLWNLKSNNGNLNRVFFNNQIKQGLINEHNVYNLVITIDKILRNEDIFDYLTMYIPQFNNAQNNYFLDHRRGDPNVFIYYLFNEYY